MKCRSFQSCFMIFKKIRILFLLLLTGCISNGFIRPDAPLCVVLSSGECSCTYKKEQYKTKCTAFIATDPDGYEAYQNYVAEIELRLKGCLRSPKLCK